MNDQELNVYLDATLALHKLNLDEDRKREVGKQLALLQSMARLVETVPLPAEVEPANVYRP